MGGATQAATAAASGRAKPCIPAKAVGGHASQLLPVKGGAGLAAAPDTATAAAAGGLVGSGCEAVVDSLPGCNGSSSGSLWKSWWPKRLLRRGDGDAKGRADAAAAAAAPPKLDKQYQAQGPPTPPLAETRPATLELAGDTDGADMSCQQAQPHAQYGSPTTIPTSAASSASLRLPLSSLAVAVSESCLHMRSRSASDPGAPCLGEGAAPCLASATDTLEEAKARGAGDSLLQQLDAHRALTSMPLHKACGSRGAQALAGAAGAGRAGHRSSGVPRACGRGEDNRGVDALGVDEEEEDGEEEEGEERISMTSEAGSDTCDYGGGGGLGVPAALVDDVMRRLREMYSCDRELGDMSLGSITQFVYRKLRWGAGQGREGVDVLGGVWGGVGCVTWSRCEVESGGLGGARRRGGGGGGLGGGGLWETGKEG